MCIFQHHATSMPVFAWGCLHSCCMVVHGTQALSAAYVTIMADRPCVLYLTWGAVEQAGTPVVKLQPEYNASARTFTLKASQDNPHAQKPQLIPLSMGLLGKDGSPVPLHLKVLHCRILLSACTELRVHAYCSLHPSM